MSARLAIGALAIALMTIGAMDYSVSADFPPNLLRSSVHLEGQGSSGSAFYVLSPDAVWLVTAKHVLFEKRGAGPMIQEFVASSPYNKPNDPGLHKLKIALAPKGAPYWLGPTSDVAVVLISRNVSGTYRPMFGVEQMPPGPQSGMVALSLSELRSYEGAIIGADVFLVGYPISLGLAKQFDPYAPMLRKGIVAGRNSSNRTLILDVPSFPGNSGGPVFQQRVEDGKTVLRCVAVMSEFVPYRRMFEGDGAAMVLIENSGLSVAASLDEVLAMMAESLKHPLNLVDP